jgi:hypothetical protein
MTQPDPGAVVITGPISGTLVVNGQSYNVTEPVLVVDSEDTASALADAIKQAHIDSGYLSGDEQ